MEVFLALLGHHLLTLLCEEERAVGHLQEPILLLAAPPDRLGTVDDDAAGGEGGAGGDAQAASGFQVQEPVLRRPLPLLVEAAQVALFHHDSSLF